MTTEQRFNRIENTLDRVTSNLERITGNQQKFDTVLSVLAEAQIELAQAQAKTQKQIDALERQWQAYLNTIRPQ